MQWLHTMLPYILYFSVLEWFAPITIIMNTHTHYELVILCLVESLQGGSSWVDFKDNSNSETAVVYYL